MDQDLRVSSVELFFDLVFVFTITQLTTLVAAEPNWTGLAKAGLIFGNVWWMFGGYAWLTNAVPPQATVLRLLMLLGMASFLVVALAIPRAFASSGVAFGVGYLAVTAVLRTGPVLPRLVIAGLALATVAAGQNGSPEWQLGALSLLLCGGIAVEAILSRQHLTAL